MFPAALAPHAILTPDLDSGIHSAQELVRQLKTQKELEASVVGANGTLHSLNLNIHIVPTHRARVNVGRVWMSGSNDDDVSVLVTGSCNSSVFDKAESLSDVDSLRIVLRYFVFISY